MKEHFENITPVKLLDWRDNDAFCVFASSTGNYGHVELGVNGNGAFTVKHNNKTYTFCGSGSAIEKYKELLNPS